MLIKDDHCILATSINPSRASINANSNKQGAYVSKIIFKESFEYVLFVQHLEIIALTYFFFVSFKTLQVMRLKAPITCLFLTRENSHLLVSLKDGKLIVITGDRQQI